MNGLPSRFDLFEEAAESLATLLDDHARDLDALLEAYVPVPDRADLKRAAADHAFAAVHSINRLRDIADEARSIARPLRVIPTEEGAAA